MTINVRILSWKDTIIDKLIVSHCYKEEHELDPELAINDLISWEVDVALDPAVSEQAQALIDKGAANLAAVTRERDEALRDLNHLADRGASMLANFMETKEERDALRAEVERLRLGRDASGGTCGRLHDRHSTCVDDGKGADAMTIEECLDIAYSWNMDILSFRTTAGRDRLRAALLALVAQARDEEAWAIQSAVHQVPTGLMTCDANGSPATEYIRREQVVADIRARIAARAEGGK